MTPTLSPIRIAIVGAGRITDLHARAYQGEPRAQLVAVCDRDPEVAQQRARAWQAPQFYTDYEEMLRNPEIDAVEICTPTSTHAAMVCQAAAAGKQISVQKPMALNLHDARKMVEACRQAGVVLKICENYVFHPPLCRAKELLEEGAIGRLLNVGIRMISGASGGWEVPSAAWQWRLEEARVAGGTQTFDHGHHMFSSAWYLGGRLDKIHGWINSVDGVVDSPATFHWNYKDSVAQGSVQFVLASEMELEAPYYCNDEWFEIVGTRGLIWVNHCTAHLRSDQPPLSLFTNGKIEHLTDIPADWFEGFQGALCNFVDAIEGKAPPRLSGEEGVTILSYALAAQQSQQQERPVYLDEAQALLPELTYQRRKYADQRAYQRQRQGPSFWERLLGSNGRLAPRCRSLTEAMPQRFAPENVQGWKATINLKIEGPHGGEWSCHIEEGQLDFQVGLASAPDLTVFCDDGTWAAILAGHRSVESAFVRQKLKIEGEVGLGLSLKKAFQL